MCATTVMIDMDKAQETNMESQVIGLPTYEILLHHLVQE